MLETHFEIPPELHELLRSSLTSPSFAGRFDYGFDGTHLKMLEYNSDSSAALLECAETQDKMARFYGFDKCGTSSGAYMFARMTKYWQAIAASQSLVQPARKLLHVMVDDDDEERYTALAVMRSAKAAGFRVKMCVRLENFKFAPVGHPSAANSPYPTVLDADGEEVSFVWKTWAWDTVIRDFRKNHLEKAEADCDRAWPGVLFQHLADAPGTSPDAPGTSSDAAEATQGECSSPEAEDPSSMEDVQPVVAAAAAPLPGRVKPTLSQVLLHPNVMVLEPFWKVVAGSKALLPLVYDRYAKEETLLAASFTLNPELQSEPYVSKPVTGRAGTKYYALQRQP